MNLGREILILAFPNQEAWHLPAQYPTAWQLLDSRGE